MEAKMEARQHKPPKIAKYFENSEWCKTKHFLIIAFTICLAGYVDIYF